MKRPRFASLIVLTLLVPAALGVPCQAAIIANGDFSEFDAATGLPTGWEHFDYDGRVAPPDYVIDGDRRYVRFPENTQLEQLFDLPANALRLSFEFLMMQEGVGIPGITPDSFQATLYDEAFEPLFGAPFGFFSVDHAGTYFDPLYVTVQPLADGWQRVSLDLRSLPAMDGVLLEFLTHGFDDGRTTTVYVDNVAAVIPEPSTGTIFAVLALLTSAILRRQRQRRAHRNGAAAAASVPRRS